MPWNHDTARAYGELGRQHHVAILESVVPGLLGSLEGRRVLDFGCGPGRLAIALAEAGAAEVVAVDESSEMVAEARANVDRSERDLRRRVVVRHGNETDLGALGGFDAVLSSLALMMCDSRPRLEAVSRALVGALKPGGRLVVVITHPCFRRRDYGTFHYVLPNDYDYWRSGVPYEVRLTPGAEHTTATITDHHWTLEDYCNALSSAGSALTRLLELPASRRDDGAPDGPPAYLAARLERIRPRTTPAPTPPREPS